MRLVLWVFVVCIVCVCSLLLTKCTYVIFFRSVLAISYDVNTNMAEIRRFKSIDRFVPTLQGSEQAHGLESEHYKFEQQHNAIPPAPTRITVEGVIFTPLTKSLPPEHTRLQFWSKRFLHCSQTGARRESFSALFASVTSK